jgi:hypothetical protein
VSVLCVVPVSVRQSTLNSRFGITQIVLFFLFVFPEFARTCICICICICMLVVVLVLLYVGQAVSNIISQQSHFLK